MQNNINIRSKLLLLLIIITGSYANAQLPSNPIGGNPLSLDWQQINTDNFQIIYPVQVERQGQRLANIIDFILNQNDTTIGPSHKKLPIILLPQSVRSNGFVTVGPFRSEIITIPPQFDCTNDWMQSVSIHEYRHVQQFSNATHGVSKTVKSILGSWAWGGMIGLALPRWYYEGDAVFSETQYSFSGRGRLAAFHMEYKALLLDEKEFNYEKAAAGSFKDYVPDWYRLGYYMINYGQQAFGEDTWKHVVENASRYKGVFFPFSQNLKKGTSLSTTQLYEQTILDLRKKWSLKADKFSTFHAAKINHLKKPCYTHYTNPIKLENGKILCEKQGLDQLNSFQIISNDSVETRIMEPGILLDKAFSRLSYANGKICFARLQFDIRRSNVNYSDIYMFDLETNKLKELSSGQYFLSPYLSKNGEKIVAVNIDSAMNSSLFVIHATSGDILSRIPNETNSYFIHPCWTQDGNEIISIAKKNQQHCLVKVNPDNGVMDTLIKPGYFQLSHPYVHQDTIVYSKSHQGTNNIFAIKIDQGKEFQLTADELGAFQPSISLNGKDLLYSSYSVNGFDIKQASMGDLLWRPENSIEKDHFQEIYENEQFQSIAYQLDTLPQKTYPSKKFNKWTGIINPHSIIPILDDPLFGVQVLSDNSFSTLSSRAGAYYNYNENHWEYEVGLDYAELFPIIHLSFSRSDRSALFYHYGSLTDTSLVQTIFVESWYENKFSGGLTIPLNLSNGNWLKSLRFQAFYRNIKLNTENQFSDPNFSQRDTFGQSQVDIEGLSTLFKPYIDNQGFHSAELSLLYQSVKKRALQHILPKWGYRVFLRYRDLINANDFSGSNLLARLDLYIPAFSKNHGIALNGMYQKETIEDNYRFSDAFVYPRGYDYSLRRDEFFKLGFNYHFPVFYPDKAIGPLAFIKRVKANVFFDHAWLKVNRFPFDSSLEYIASMGVELSTDFRALRILEIDLGLRYSYVFSPEFTRNNRRHQVEFILLKISDQ